MDASKSPCHPYPPVCLISLFMSAKEGNTAFLGLFRNRPEVSVGSLHFLCEGVHGSGKAGIPLSHQAKEGTETRPHTGYA